MRKMKDSGIEWVGQVPENWLVLRSKFCYYNNKYVVGVASKKYDRLALTLKGVIKRSKDANDGLQPENFDSYQLLKKNELVFKLIDLKNVSTSRVGFSDFLGIVSPAYVVLNSKNDKVLSKYGYYYFYSMWQREIFNQLGDAGVRSNLSASDLLNLGYILPSLPEQQDIANFLDNQCSQIDILISDIEKSIVLLEEYKKSVITEAVTMGLDHDVEMKKSGVDWCPVVPMHWEKVKSKILFGVRSQKAFVGERQLSSSQKYGIIYQDELINLENQKVVVVEKNYNLLNHVEIGDFVISMRSFQGGLEYSRFRGSISSAYVMLIPNQKYVNDEFFKWFFKSSSFISGFQSTSNLIREGQALKYHHFVKLDLFIIPLEEQKKIAKYLDEITPKIENLIDAKRKQIDCLKEYKKSIIYEYVTGKKEVPTT